MGCTQGKDVAVPKELTFEEEHEAYVQKIQRKLERIKEMEEKKKRDEYDPLSKANLWREVENAFLKYDLDNDGKLSCKEATAFIRDWTAKIMDGRDAAKVATFDDLDLYEGVFLSKDDLYVFIKDKRTLQAELIWMLDKSHK